MDWLNRLDDALDDAANTSHQMQNVDAVASLSELVTHLRSTTETTDNARSSSSSQSNFKGVANTGLNNQDAHYSTHFSTSPPSQGSSNLQRLDGGGKARQQINLGSLSHKDVSGHVDIHVINQNQAASDPPHQPSKHSPWGKALDFIFTAEKPETRNNSIRPDRHTTTSAKALRANPNYDESMPTHDKKDNVPLVSDQAQKSGPLVVKQLLMGVDCASTGSLESYDGEKNSSIPQSLLLKSPYHVDYAMTSWEDNDGIPYVPGMNCFGVFHVRVLRAQRLPCPVGSRVYGVLALPPWKGKVRTPIARATSGMGTTVNVCVDWSDIENSVVSMVHAYSSEESPVPSIRVAIVFSAASIGMLEFEMCSVEVPCTALLKKPHTSRCGWFETTKSLAGNESHKSTQHSYIPLVQIEAVFEPGDENTPESPPIKCEEDETDEWEGADASSVPSGGCDLLPQDITSPFDNSEQLTADDRSHRSDLSTSLPPFRLSSSKTHHLRAKVFHLFARCAVCSRSITSGFRRVQAYRCEDCGVDSCSDCRLQVDFRLPCGSRSAQAAVERSIQSKITPENILRILAPIHESESGAPTHPPNAPEISPALEWDAKGPSVGVSPARGIGVLKANIIRAVVLQSPESLDSFESDLVSNRNVKRGDYYVRITGSNGGTVRTNAVQDSGRPRFESGEMRLAVPHYGTDFCFELVDDLTDNVIGATILPTNAILQEQRDMLASTRIVPFVGIFGGPMAFKKARRVILKLKRPKQQNATSFFSESSDGSTMGCVEVDILLEEDMDALYGPNPYECPARAHNQLDLAILQSHAARFSNLIRDFKKLGEFYNLMVSWKNPMVTGICALVYFYICISCTFEYIGAMLVFGVLALMVYLGFDRAHGRFQRRFISRELQKINERESKSIKVHRPIGMVKVKVLQGSNLKHPEYGIPGSAGCRVYLDPSRFLSDDDRHRAAASDEAMAALHELGYTESLYSSDPVWQKLTESEESKRLHYLVPSDNNLLVDGNHAVVTSEFRFPVLQPCRHDGQNFLLQPWSACSSAILFEVRFSDLVSIVPGSEHILGEVVVPVSALISNGIVRGWFKVLEAGKETRALEPTTDVVPDETPQLLVQLTWIPPEGLLGSLPHREREASVVIQEEMSRIAVLRRQQKISLLGSSIGAFNTVRTLTSTLLSVQNVLGTILDAVESFSNIFNFSDPYKSSVFFSAMLLLWVVLSFVPTRLLMSLAGIGQFGTALLHRCFPPGKPEKIQSDSQTCSNSKSNLSTWLSNAFLGLPSDEDLRRTYYWETRRVVEHENRSRSAANRSARLTALWNASWHGKVEIMSHSFKQRHSAFGVIQGHRFLWWDSTVAFDGGERAAGELHLLGHAGVATPSPVEMREVLDKEMNRLSVVFGRGESAQERIGLLFEDALERDRFEASVLQAILRKVD